MLKDRVGIAYSEEFYKLYDPHFFVEVFFILPRNMLKLQHQGLDMALRNLALHHVFPSEEHLLMVDRTDVRLHGLKSSAGQMLNGLSGTIRTFDESQGRYIVDLKGRRGKNKAIKPANVELQDSRYVVVVVVVVIAAAVLVVVGISMRGLNSVQKRSVGSWTFLFCFPACPISSCSSYHLICMCSSQSLSLSLLPSLHVYVHTGTCTFQISIGLSMPTRP